MSLPAAPLTPETQDSAELEALFDSIASAAREQSVGRAPNADGNTPSADKMISQIGQLTRKLHDAMRELGYDRLIQKAAEAIPNARDRLSYVATMTEQAAVRALNAIEAAKPIQDRLGNDASSLAGDWDRLFKRELTVEEFKALAERTRTFLGSVPAQTKATSAQLMDIMMAQDFQDLTGQVIKRITDMVQDIEGQLLGVLLENCPPELREAAEHRGLLNGPVMSGKNLGEALTSQSQVDELLGSLGF